MKRTIFPLLTALIPFVCNELGAVEFQTINSRFGLSMRQTYTVCEDDHGFIWASARTGILRVTDGDYRIYHLDYDPEWLNVFSVKLASGEGRLAAYTDNGQIFMYDPVGDRFDKVLNLGASQSNAHFALNRVLVDERGLWVASSAGLFRHENDRTTRISGLGVECFDIERLDGDNIFVAADDGIHLYNISSGMAGAMCDVGAGIHVATALRFDEGSGQLWIGTRSEGLYRLDIETKTLHRTLPSALPSDFITAISPYSDSTVLVGIDGQGIWEVAVDGSRVVDIHREDPDNPSSLPGNGVQNIFCDSRGRVWVSTYNGGISWFQKENPNPAVLHLTHRINDPNSLANNSVSSVLEDSSGRWWFTTDNGVSRYDPADGEWSNLHLGGSNRSRSFTSICQDDRGRVWVGSLADGLFLLDGDTGGIVSHWTRGTGSPLAFNFVTSVYKDLDGDVWINDTVEGLVCYLSAEDRFERYSRSAGVIEMMPDGKMLLGDFSGLSLLDKRTGHSGWLLSGILIHDLLVIDDMVWLCTAGAGLLEYDYTTGTITKRYTVAEGLPSNYVNSILNKDGILWVGTESGLCRVDPVAQKVDRFASTDLFSSLSFNRRARLGLSSGHLAWGTNDGVVVFAPDSLHNNRVEGRLYFQDIHVSGRSVRENDRVKLTVPIDSLTSIRLPRGTDGFSLELLSLDAPGDSRLSWLMEEVDSGWSEPRRNRVITYNRLSGGRHTLGIRLWDSSLTDIIAERKLIVVVTRPFFGLGRGTLAVTIVAVVALAAALLVSRWRRKISADGAKEPTRFDLREVLSDLSHQSPRSQRKSVTMKASSLSNDEIFLKRATEVAAKNLVNPYFSKNDFAVAMHVSSSLLYKRLKSLTGLSPSDYIRSARLKHAMDLLISGHFSGVTEVSELCGFSSVSYFSTTFRKHFGKPPSEFMEKS
jgi:ligand-binding sensor domain-containing protein/AraC-like DNA-binding protein